MKKLKNLTAVRREEVKTQTDLDNMARIAAQHGFNMSKQHKVEQELSEYAGNYIQVADGAQCFQNCYQLEDDAELITLAGFMSYDKDLGAVEKPSKYDRTIIGKCGTKVIIDVYRILEAYSTNNPILDHITKKSLNAGNRGHKGTMQDLLDIKASIEEAIKLEEQK